MQPFHFILSQAQPAQESGWLRWLLGLDRIDPTRDEAVFTWQHNLPGWAWALVVLAVILVGLFSYRRLLGKTGARVTLAAARGLLILLVALLLAGPMLVLPRENREPDRLLMLLDRSDSMQVRDVPGGAQRISRDEQLKQLLSLRADTWNAIAREHELDWTAFSGRTVAIEGPQSLPDVGGSATAVSSAIREALGRASGRPISAVVLFSDGRSSEPLDAGTLRHLERLDVPVISVPLGSDTPLADLALDRLEAPDRAFTGDIVPVNVTAVSAGDTAVLSQAPPGTVVRLIDTATQEVLDEKPVETLGQSVTLLHTPQAAGRASWRVQLVTTESELSLANNEQTLDLTFEDRPVRVLYVEGYPRWEYRYLKTLLKREQSLESSIMLISADRSFAQEGDLPLRRLPQTEEEIEPYDVIIIGDVPPTYFSADQLRLIHEHVSGAGAGLMFIGGPYEMPVTYSTSPLASLLPVANAAAVTTLSPPIVFKPTALSRSLGVLYLQSEREPSSQEGWPDTLPPLFWAQSLTTLKPAAEALAVDQSTNQALLARMRFGAGQTLYVATDEIWRWRKPWGELYMDQFWTQLMRMLARGRLESGGTSSERVVFNLSRRRAATGDTLALELRIRDQTLLDRASTEIRMDIETQQSVRGTAAVETLTLTPSGSPGVFRADWMPRTPGRKTLRVTTPHLSEVTPPRTLDVADADDEMRYPVTDHAFLTELAAKTGGMVIPPDQLDQLPTRIKNRARITTADLTEPLTHSPLVFVLLLVLLTGEWLGRKWLGLA